MKYSIIVEYAGQEKEFIVDLPDEFFPSNEGRKWMGDEKFDDLTHSNIVEDFYSRFNLTIRPMKEAGQ